MLEKIGRNIYREAGNVKASRYNIDQLAYVFGAVQQNKDIKSVQQLQTYLGCRKKGLLFDVRV